MDEDTQDENIDEDAHKEEQTDKFENFKRLSQGEGLRDLRETKKTFQKARRYVEFLYGIFERRIANKLYCISCAGHLDVTTNQLTKMTLKMNSILRKCQESVQGAEHEQWMPDTQFTKPLKVEKVRFEKTCRDTRACAQLKLEGIGEDDDQGLYRRYVNCVERIHHINACAEQIRRHLERVNTGQLNKAMANMHLLADMGLALLDDMVTAECFEMPGDSDESDDSDPEEDVVGPEEYQRIYSEIHKLAHS